MLVEVDECVADFEPTMSPDRVEQSTGSCYKCRMQVTVDSGMCASTASCMHICPEVFELGQDGVVHVLQIDPDEILRKRVLEAANMCPTGAITVDE